LREEIWEVKEDHSSVVREAGLRGSLTEGRRGSRKALKRTSECVEGMTKSFSEKELV